MLIDKLQSKQQVARAVLTYVWSVCLGTDHFSIYTIITITITFTFTFTINYINYIYIKAKSNRLHIDFKLPHRISNIIKSSFQSKPT